MSKRTMIREDRLGMWTVTYSDGTEQHFNSEVEAQAAVKRDGRSDEVVAKAYVGEKRDKKLNEDGDEPS